MKYVNEIHPLFFAEIMILERIAGFQFRSMMNSY